MATMPAPAYLNRGIADTTATARQAQIGVCSFGCTLASTLEPGSRLSRAMPKHRRMVAVMMLMQQTRMAADTTRR